MPMMEATLLECTPMMIFSMESGRALLDILTIGALF
jgi:hypothetical protein